MDSLYNQVCQECSALVTKRYSTSFSMGIRLFDKKFRKPIYNIYGFVRFADEIVDTFYGVDQKQLLSNFKEDTFKAIRQGVSLNPVLQSFQKVVNDYDIDHDYIHAFLESMEMDLYQNQYDQKDYEKYIYGSAEVVGLMCLQVFVSDKKESQDLIPYARSLGSAFQKINFLRDLKSDYQDRGRTYFPGVEINHFDDKQKVALQKEIKIEFDHAFIGIKKLPKEVRLGVYVAYVYYINLYKKICNTAANQLLAKRIRVRNRKKIYLLTKSSLKHSFSML